MTNEEKLIRIALSCGETAHMQPINDFQKGLKSEARDILAIINLPFTTYSSSWNWPTVYVADNFTQGELRENQIDK